MIDHVSRQSRSVGPSLSRRGFMLSSAAIAAGLGTSSLIVSRSAAATGLKTVRFSEAVHNLGYINLYVGMHAGIFKKNGLDMQVSAAGGDTQTFAAVLGGSADFAIGDATMAQISRENGGPGVVVGTVVQRAHYFGVSKTLQPITDPKEFKGLKIVTSPEPNTNYSVAKRLLEKAGLKVGTDATIVPVNPGTEIAAMLAGQADIAIAYQPSVAAAEAQGAKVVFDFSTYIGPFCNTGIMVLPTTIQKDPEMVQALVTSFEEASRKTYADPAFSKEVARKEFPRSSRRGCRQGDRRRAEISDPGAVGRHQAGSVEEPHGYAGLPWQRQGIGAIRADHRQLVC
jgi:NitT/TauT family transport system substrate-binding protein